MLGFVFIIVVSVFGLMLATSYAWYSYENASTKFDVVAANDNVEIIFQSGEYINTNSAVPIKSIDIDRYSSKYDFNIRVKNQVVGNEMVAKVSLIDIAINNKLKEIDSILGDSPFRVELFYQGNRVGNVISGKDFITDSYEFGDVVLSGELDNQFELRVYLLDNGGDQAYLMNQKFQAKIDVNVISRVDTSFKSFDEADISISSIVIDGYKSDSLPVSGFYNMTASCEKGSNISWDSFSKTLVYGRGSYMGDKCTLTFTKGKSQIYLKDAMVGSYVRYVGNNGCSGNSCLGENVHYKDDNRMGYCGDEHYQFSNSGFRIMYVKDDSVYLVSAGALECSSDTNNLNQLSVKYCNRKYVYNGDCDSVRSFSVDDINLIDDKSKDLIDNGSYYWYLDGDDVFSWNPKSRELGDKGNGSYGVRAVIRLDSGVMVDSGNGSYADPYIISK